MPESSIVRHFDLSVGYAVIAPDGVQKNGLVVNGGFPGPLIEANWGEWIEITVTVSSMSRSLFNIARIHLCLL